MSHAFTLVTDDRNQVRSQCVVALGVVLVQRRWTLLRPAVRTLVLGSAAAIVDTTVAALAARGLGWITESDITGPRPDTGFIYTPDKWLFIVALIAAGAGALSLTSAKVAGLSVVFISVTTVPPLATSPLRSPSATATSSGAAPFN